MELDSTQAPGLAVPAPVALSTRLPGSDRVRRDRVDGVPVFWTPGPAPFAAGLVFGVGRRDETFVRGGVTHLVEHLAMSALGRTTLECNATVDLTTTEFTAVGRPDMVVEFLRRVCEALSDLPLDRLAIEADVLRTENGVVASPVVGALLAERYGARGAGLAGYREPALGALTAQDVQAWASTWFVRRTAALWLSGPPPDGLSLPLPDGSPPPRQAQPLRAVSVPALVEHPVDGVVALGADVPRMPGLSAACRVLRDRVEDDLRHRRGVSYTVDTDQVLVRADRRFVTVSADCRQGQEAVATRALWQGLVRLADEGPTQAELAHERAALGELLADPRTLVEEARAAACGSVTGIPYRRADELWEEAQALTPEQVRGAARAIRDGALVGVPAGVHAALPELTQASHWSSDVVSGQSFARRRVGSDAPRGSRLVVGDAGVSVVLREGEQLSVRYDEALALLRVAPGEWTLTGADGVTVPLAPRDWRDGDSALQLVAAAVPRELQADADDIHPPGRRVLLLHAPPHAAAEALWSSRHDAWVLATERWSLVVREPDDVDPGVVAAQVSGALGRRHALLLLEQAHDELRVVVLRGGKERDRHVWSGQRHDASVLAGLLGADPEELAALLAHPGRPADVLVELERTLGVPSQARQVLAGTPLEQVPGLVHEPARGLRESFRASVRGEFDPPESTALHHRLTRWENQRPPAYRAVNAAAAAGQAVVAGVLASGVDGDWTSWTGGLAALFAAGALGSLWSARPPAR